MRPTRNTITAAFILILCQVTIPAFSQLGFTIPLKKPQEYDERLLKSERSDEKKFTLPKRLIQNATTHYNFYFNANNKLNDVLERAKTAFKDDYSLLLPFYNYSLDATAGDSIQLDSITYKSSTAIALHDLRNDWVDNMYLLWGASYYLQKKFDSAYLMFQFINYAFAPKEKDGYYLAIGSARDGNSAYSISSKEKKSLPSKIFSEPPSRNDAFIWQIRTFLAKDEFAEAASLIVTLRNDPNFPKRLQNDLHEVQAYWFYKQNMWDSSATHLVQALSNATNLQEKARWEYLAAQLYEISGNHKEAEKYYVKVSSHTTDPILDIYARLYAVRVNKGGGDKTIEKNVAELLKMAKRDKFEDYQDIIYYMAAQMQLEGNNIEEALRLLQKSSQFASNDPALRNRVFLQLAELSFAKKDYRKAANFYDSLRLDDPSLKDVEAITARKTTLRNLATNFEIAERQDSLQRIAALPEDERKDLIKKLVKEIRKKQGLKEESVSAGPAFVIPTLFPTADAKGEWYFYNAANKTRGLAAFKSKWGARPNVDNWRRSSTINAALMNSQQGQGNLSVTQGQTGGNSGSAGPTYEDLYANLPVTTEQLEKSNDSLQTALFELGKIYVQEIEDCKAGTETLEQVRNRFPKFKKMDEVLFNLYFCYNKNGESAKAAAIKKLMGEKFGSSNFTTIITTGKNPKASANPDATKAYEKIYDLFIEGNFAQAIADKKIADSLYGKNYWTPQLLYIEAVYYIKQRNDSTAITTLNSILTQFPNTPLANKATNLLSVLSRRAQIEEELRNLNVSRAAIDTTTRKQLVAATQPKTDSIKTQPQANNTTPKAITDTLNKKLVAIAAPYKFNATEPCYVVLVLNKVDPVFCNETKNAFARFNRETYYNKPMTADLFDIDAENRVLLLSPFKDAQDAVTYVDAVRPRTATEILPWLKGGKYSFIILSDSNFDILKMYKDIDNYKAFLNQYLPGKF
jgi:outer membrane protein assembly factor BamD (BamD/ComL family)/predicted negative regulator of RcsB-dependent stress response